MPVSISIHPVFSWGYTVEAFPLPAMPSFTLTFGFHTYFWVYQVDLAMKTRQSKTYVTIGECQSLEVTGTKWTPRTTICAHSVRSLLSVSTVLGEPVLDKF